MPSTIPLGLAATQSLSLLGDLRVVFRNAGERLLTDPDSYGDVTREAREKIGALLSGCQPSEEKGDPLAYPLRASRRFLEGEAYRPIRFRALERIFLKREGYLQGLRDALPRIDSIPSPNTERTIPSPPVTMTASNPPSFEECCEMIERAAATRAVLPEELQFIDLTGREIRGVREKNRAIAGRVLDLPMKAVFERIFSRVFHIDKNPWDVPAFWVEKLSVAPFLAQSDKPSVRISCNLASIDELQAFVLAVRTMLNIPNPIEILLEGRFDWREGALYMPMKPVRLSGNIIPPDTLFGAAIPILVPIDGEKTVLALDLEDKILSKNPEVFVEAIARGID